MIRRLALPDLLELSERLRFLMSAREPWESTSDEGERLRRRSLIGLADREVLEGERRRRRGGVRDRDRDRDRDTLGAGELNLTGERDREICLDSLLLSLRPPDRLGDLLRRGEERRRRLDGDAERLPEGE